MNLTDEQRAIVLAEHPVTKVIAFAGTGKTSTLIAESQAKRKRGLYLAFNKSVQLEAEQKFPDCTTCRTTHSLAYGSHGRRFNIGKLSYFKISKAYQINFYAAAIIGKTLDFFLNSADEQITEDHAVEDMLGKLGPGYKSQVVDKARETWTRMQANNDPNLPMTHSGYLKLYQLSKPRLNYDVLMVDEFQDTNPVTVDIVMRQKDRMRIIAVGDGYQAIYGWRGAINALDKMDAETYYLTQSFRFGSEIAGAANTILSTFFGETRPLVGLGKPGTIIRRPATVPYTILARTNAMLFARATDLCQKHKLYSPGAETGNMQLFDSVMNVYWLYMNNRYEIKDPEVKLFDNFEQLKHLVEEEAADPELAISTHLVSKYGSRIPNLVEQVRKSLTRTPGEAQIILSTAHKSKGLEWDTVVLEEDFTKLYDDENGGTGNLKSAEEIGPEEINLLYVAATRAKRLLKPNGHLSRLLGVEVDVAQTALAAKTG